MVSTLKRIERASLLEVVDSNNMSAFSEQRLGHKHCFICGTQLIKGHNKSKEHVIPKWVLSRYDLWNTGLGILNGTILPYKDHTVPCCKTCNSEALSHVENLIREAVTQGYESVVSLSKEDLFLWSLKIFYANLYKENMLKADRRNPNSSTLVPDALMRSGSMRGFHHILQGARFGVEFHPHLLSTVLVVNLYGSEKEFSFSDNAQSRTLMIRMGSIGIIVAFEDFGINYLWAGKVVEGFAGRKLYFDQFVDLFAEVTYTASLLKYGYRFDFLRVLKRGTALMKTMNRQYKRILVTHIPADKFR